MNQDYKRNASLADTFLYMPFNIENLKIEISVLIKNYRFLRKSFLQKIFGEKFLETDIEEMPEEDNYQLINKVKKFILDNLDNESLKISHIASETDRGSSHRIHDQDSYGKSTRTIGKRKISHTGDT